MLAALECLRNELKREEISNGKRIIVAVPCAAPDTLKKIGKLADHVICLTSPYGFQAVG